MRPNNSKVRPTDASIVMVGEEALCLDQIVDVAQGRAQVQISPSAQFRTRLHKSRQALDRALEQGIAVYGTNTGYGAACGSRVDAASMEELGQNLIRYHGCGVGEPLGIPEVRAGILCRMLSLARGYSAVGVSLLEAMADLLNHHITPVIPSQGSVGASGDLTPLSYLAACLAGERDAFYRGQRMPASRALEQEGLKPVRFEPKEPLALINGTSILTGLAAIAVKQSQHLLHAATCASALTVHALAGHDRHFHPTLFEVKPFPGQAQVAHALRQLLSHQGDVGESTHPEHLQDPYSCRCSPHILGVLADALAWIQRWVEIEANGVCDNPLLDPDSAEVLTGGNFYGGHITFAMDGLKQALASLADMCDRQVALLVDPKFSRGLPANLVRGHRPDLHHGFKGIQITITALTAEIQKQAAPIGVFSRSTESHNQDKVSLGTIASRDALTICRHCSLVVAIHLLAACQAAEIRGKVERRPELATVAGAIRKISALLLQDRAMDEDIARLADAVLAGKMQE